MASQGTEYVIVQAQDEDVMECLRLLFTGKAEGKISISDEDVMECLHLLFTDETEGNGIEAVANGDQEELNRKDEATGGVDSDIIEINDTPVMFADQADLESIKTNATDAAVSVSVTEVSEASTVPDKISEDIKMDKPVEYIPNGLYEEILDLETLALLPNSEPFQCLVCTEDCEVGAGVVLRDCAHHFCRECLSSAVKHCLGTTIACPATHCTGSLEQREIRFLSTPEGYQRWLARGLDEAEGTGIDAAANGDQEEANRKDEATGGVDTNIIQINDTPVMFADQADLESIKTNATDAAVSVSVTKVNKAITVPDKIAENIKMEKPVEYIPTGLYEELLDLETLALLPNSEPFQCRVCAEDCEVGAGVVLRDCAHHFCRECLSSTVKHSLETAIACPATHCTGSLEQREIRFLSTPEEYERWLARGLDEAEGTGIHAAANGEKPVGYIPIGLYEELLDLETLALLPNSEPFQCPVCTEDCEMGAGVVLRDCAHHFCRECLSSTVKHSLETTVACPATQCTGSLEEREIRFLSTPEEYERWLARGLVAVERSSKETFHCRMRDCRGWAFYDSDVQSFDCPICQCVTCVPCRAIHEGETCQQHLRKREEHPTQQQSRSLLNNWIGDGIAMKCPECGITITKIDGCDGMQCSACKTKICWATRGRRWGPGGAGDDSGGCRCNVNGKLCHPSCRNCH